MGNRRLSKYTIKQQKGEYQQRIYNKRIHPGIKQPAAVCLFDRLRHTSLPRGGVRMNSVGVEAGNGAAGMEQRPLLDARDSLLLEHLMDPAITGLELASGGLLAIGKLHGHHAGAAGSG